MSKGWIAFICFIIGIILCALVTSWSTGVSFLQVFVNWYNAVILALNTTNSTEAIIGGILK